jgi:hypothetical protein
VRKEKSGQVSGAVSSTSCRANFSYVSNYVRPSPRRKCRSGVDLVSMAFCVLGAACAPPALPGRAAVGTSPVIRGSTARSYWQFFFFKKPYFFILLYKVIRLIPSSKAARDRL